MLGRGIELWTTIGPGPADCLLQDALWSPVSATHLVLL